MSTSESASKVSETETPSELHDPIWSVVSFDRHEEAGLTYDAAAALLARLAEKKVPGLTVVTDEAARRMIRL